MYGCLSERRGRGLVEWRRLGMGVVCFEFVLFVGEGVEVVGKRDVNVGVGRRCGVGVFFLDFMFRDDSSFSVWVVGLGSGGFWKGREGLERMVFVRKGFFYFCDGKFCLEV